jgi:hypothetical protein
MVTEAIVVSEATVTEAKVTDMVEVKVDMVDRALTEPLMTPCPLWLRQPPP